MKRIWKEEIGGALNALRDDETPVTFDAPRGARIIHVGLDPNGLACVWYEWSDFPGNPQFRETITLYCVGTGYGCVDPSREYVGSVLTRDFMWHLYKGGIE